MKWLKNLFKNYKVEVQCTVCKKTNWDVKIKKGTKPTGTKIECNYCCCKGKIREGRSAGGFTMLYVGK